MHIEILILLMFCHWLADFTHLQRPKMLAAKKFGTPLFPILDHALTHALFMGVVVAIFAPKPLVISLVFVQLVSHFVIDTLKGKLNIWFPSLQHPSNPFHWYVFGLDQFLHHLVIIFMWYSIIKII